MSRTAHFGKEAQDHLVKGLNYVANAVKSTGGPGGKTVIIQRTDKTPLITKDGISVARELEPKDEKIKLGADLAISIAQKQMDTVGDGTTMATILGQAIVNSGVRQLELAENKVNRTSVKKGLEKTKDFLIGQLEEMALPLAEGGDQLVQIATISANGDEKIGQIVADAYSKVGKAGVVLVEESKERDVTLDFKEGMTLDRGWTSPYFVNNHSTQTVEFDNPKILLVNSKINNFNSLVQLIEPEVKRGSAVVIIAEGFDTTVIHGILMNVSRNHFPIACIEAPGYGDRRLEILRDLGVYLDAEVADDPLGLSFEATTTAAMGTCDKIIIKKDETIMRGGSGDPVKIQSRVEHINGTISALKDNEQWEKRTLGERVAALTTGVAVIQVGGSSEEEVKELRDRIDDAQWACKSALEEGYLPGAGNSLLMLSERVMGEVETNNVDEKLGVQIFASALKAPCRAILENAGVSADDIIEKLLTDKKIDSGYDARELKYVNLLESGIIDPVKTVKGAVFAATSIASLILTSDVVITEDPNENANAALQILAGGMGPMMG